MKDLDLCIFENLFEMSCFMLLINYIINLFFLFSFINEVKVFLRMLINGMTSDKLLLLDDII